MNGIEDSFDDIFGAYKDEYDRSGQQRVDQEELNRQKQAPKAGKFLVPTVQVSSALTVRTRPVKAPVNNRRGRKLAEAEQIRQWEMDTKTLRTGKAIESVAAVGVYAFRTVDGAQNALADAYFGGKRREVMNPFMRRTAGRCLGLTEAGIMAIAESYPKRIAEDL